MKKPFKYSLYTLGMFLSLGLLAVLIYQAKGSFVKIWQTVQTKYLVLSVISSALIYISMGMSLYEMLRIMGRRISKSAAIGIALVSTTVNYLISSLGASGFALRAHLLNRRRVPFGTCVTASIVITVLLYFVLAVIILQGSILMLFHSSATPVQLLKNFGIIVVMCAVCAVITALLFNNELRYKSIRKLFRLLNKVLFHGFGALIRKGHYDDFMDQLDEGIALIHKKTGPKSPHKLTEKGQSFIDRYISDHPGANSSEVNRALLEETGISVHNRTVDRYMAKKYQGSRR